MRMEKEKGAKDSFQQKIFDLIEKEHGHNNKITIPIVLIDFCGDSETASFLSQLIYWCDKGKSPDGYIYKSRREWHQEIGLSEYLIEKCAGILESQGLLATKKKRANGHPTIHYRLNKKELVNALIKFLRNDSEKIKSLNLKNLECITEPTTEPTAKPTKNYGVNSNELHSIPLSFKEYKETTPLNADTIEVIEYFLEQYKRCQGEKHPNLKPQQWERVVATLFFCHDDALDGKSFDLDVETLQIMIDRYFETAFQEGCNYSIIHFNNSEIKLRRLYEVAY
jgi:hypothetical protein